MPTMLRIDRREPRKRERHPPVRRAAREVSRSWKRVCVGQARVDLASGKKRHPVRVRDQRGPRVRAAVPEKARDALSTAADTAEYRRKHRCRVAPTCGMDKHCLRDDTIEPTVPRVTTARRRKIIKALEQLTRNVGCDSDGSARTAHVGNTV